MAKPHRVCVPRKDEKTGKTYWTNIGAAFPRDRGGMSVMLDALPIGRELIIFPPDAEGSSGREAPKSDTNGDDVPY
jgi:hypothetical protein